jgi:hypothetical protein
MASQRQATLAKTILPPHGSALERPTALNPIFGRPNSASSRIRCLAADRDMSRYQNSGSQSAGLFRGRVNEPALTFAERCFNLRFSAVDDGAEVGPASYPHHTRDLELP